MTGGENQRITVVELQLKSAAQAAIMMFPLNAQVFLVFGWLFITSRKGCRKLAQLSAGYPPNLGVGI